MKKLSINRLLILSTFCAIFSVNVFADTERETPEVSDSARDSTDTEASRVTPQSLNVLVDGVTSGLDRADALLQIKETLIVGM